MYLNATSLDKKNKLTKTLRLIILVTYQFLSVKHGSKVNRKLIFRVIMFKEKIEMMVEWVSLSVFSLKIDSFEPNV